MEYPYRVDRMTRTELLGWCIAFRVWAYGYNGVEIPTSVLLRSLDCAVQHHQIYGKLWDRIGGLGYKCGDPNRPY